MSDAMRNVRENRSMLNPTDVAMAATEGSIRPDMTFGEYCEKNIGVSWDEPLRSAIPKLQKQLQNRTALGKMNNIAQGARRGRPAFVRPGQGMSPPPTEEPGLESMMNQMR